MIESECQRRDSIVGKNLKIYGIRGSRKGSDILKTKQNKANGLILEQIEGNETQSTGSRIFLRHNEDTFPLRQEGRSQ